jgi:hypothetical protein
VVPPGLDAGQTGGYQPIGRDGGLAGPSDTPAPPPRCTIGEVYSFELVRTRGGWRFSRIETVPLWVSGTVPTPARAA